MNIQPYLYHELVPLLKFQATVADYLATVTQQKTTRDDTAYRSLLPVYRYAVCPICQTACEETIDTYALPLYRFEFQLVDNAPPYNYPIGYNTPCPHYFGVHTFLNLHDQTLPTRIVSMTFLYGEVPYLSPWFVPDDVESYAVLHALPICEIVDERFVPRYTRFLLTYFSANPRLLLDRVYARQREAAKRDDRYDAYIMAQPYRKPIIEPVYDDVTQNFPNTSDEFKRRFDLPYWVEQGKLAWLNPETLALELGPEKALPPTYQNIKGRPYFMQWKRGRLEPR